MPSYSETILQTWIGGIVVAIPQVCDTSDSVKFRLSLMGVQPMKKWPFINENFRRLIRIFSIDEGREYFFTPDGIISDDVSNTLAYNSIDKYKVALNKARELITQGVFGRSVYLDGQDVTEEMINGKRRLVRWSPTNEDVYGLVA